MSLSARPRIMTTTVGGNLLKDSLIELLRTFMFAGEVSDRSV